MYVCTSVYMHVMHPSEDYYTCAEKHICMYTHMCTGVQNMHGKAPKRDVQANMCQCTCTASESKAGEKNAFTWHTYPQ